MSAEAVIWLALACTIGPVLVAGVIAWRWPDLT